LDIEGGANNIEGLDAFNARGSRIIDTPFEGFT